MMRYRLQIHCVFIMAFLAMATSSSFSEAADIVVITHPSSSVNSISRDDLRQILMINRTHWENGNRILLFAVHSDEGNSDLVFRELMGMTYLQAKKHWLTKVFNGVLTASPTVASSGDDVCNLVAKMPDSIAVLPEGTPISKVKIVQLTQ